MKWVDTSDLQKRFISPLLIEVQGDRSDLAGPLCELVDVLADGTSTFTILHVPGGSLPAETQRAMGIVYEDADEIETGESADGEVYRALDADA